MNLHRDLTSEDFAKLHELYGRPRALGRILGMVENYGCKTIVIEEDPDSEEYKAEYDYFFKNVLSIANIRTPTRIHFFKGLKETIEDIVDNDPSYLGFCDLRPNKPASISTAIIDPKVFSGPSEFLYLICKDKFSIPFANNTLTVEGFPYVQQDGRAIRCAQAAFTSISMFYKKKINGPDFTKIVDQMSLTGKRAVPSDGMGKPHIGLGWKKLQREPQTYSYDKGEKLESTLLHREQIIYRYLESGLPVLLGIATSEEAHALVVIGHTFTPDSWIAQTETAYYNQPKTGETHHCSTNWIEKFIVQDDNLGPYTLILSAFLKNYCNLISVGLPPKIYCLGEAAEGFVGFLFSPQIHNFPRAIDEYVQRHIGGGGRFHDETKFWYEEFKTHAKKSELVLRTYLRESTSWKRDISTMESYSEYADLLSSLPLPDMIWVVEISWPQIFRHGRFLCGEIVIDPTDEVVRSKPTINQGWLWVHLPGVVLSRNAVTGEVKARVLTGKDIIRTHFVNK